MHLKPLRAVDPAVAELIVAEERRQRDVLRLIPSENYVSAAVQVASGSVLGNKYSEGYPGKRYYQGQAYADQVEDLARERARSLFGVDHANLQPYSGSPANLAVYFSLLQPGDTILSMSLPHGGHLTHGWKVTISGKYYQAVQYGVRPEDQRIDFAQVRSLALEHRPKLIICGASAYPRTIDFAAFREIADEVGALLMADIAHIAGLVAGGAHPSPAPFADVITTTTHKTLRGPRGGMILCRQAHAQAIDRGVFPGLQGGPHMHTIAGVAVALQEAAQPAFKDYARQVVVNAQTLGERLMHHGLQLTTGGTDNHLLLIDLSEGELTGKVAARALEVAGIVCNANSVPFDRRKPFNPSGVRLGTPSLTSRGMGEAEMRQLGDWIAQVLRAPEDEAAQLKIAEEVRALCASFPAPGLPEDPAWLR